MGLVNKYVSLLAALLVLVSWASAQGPNQQVSVYFKTATVNATTTDTLIPCRDQYYNFQISQPSSAEIQFTVNLKRWTTPLGGDLVASLTIYGGTAPTDVVNGDLGDPLATSTTNCDATGCDVIVSSCFNYPNFVALVRATSGDGRSTFNLTITEYNVPYTTLPAVGSAPTLRANAPTLIGANDDPTKVEYISIFDHYRLSATSWPVGAILRITVNTTVLGGTTTVFASCYPTFTNYQGLSPATCYDTDFSYDDFQATNNTYVVDIQYCDCLLETGLNSAIHIAVKNPTTGSGNYTIRAQYLSYNLIQIPAISNTYTTTGVLTSALGSPFSSMSLSDTYYYQFTDVDNATDYLIVTISGVNQYPGGNVVVEVQSNYIGPAQFGGCGGSITSCSTDGETICTAILLPCEFPNGVYYFTVYTESGENRYDTYDRVEYGLNITRTQVAPTQVALNPSASNIFEQIGTISGAIAEEGNFHHYYVDIAPSDLAEDSYLLIEVYENTDLDQGNVYVYLNYGAFAGGAGVSDPTTLCWDSIQSCTMQRYAGSQFQGSCNFYLDTCHLQAGQYYITIVNEDTDTPYDTELDYTIHAYLGTSWELVSSQSLQSTVYETNIVQFHLDVDEADWEYGQRLFVHISDVDPTTTESAVTAYVQFEALAGECPCYSFIVQCRSDQGAPFSKSGDECALRIPPCLFQPGRYYIGVEGTRHDGYSYEWEPIGFTITPYVVDAPSPINVTINSTESGETLPYDVFDGVRYDRYSFSVYERLNYYAFEFDQDPTNMTELRVNLVIEADYYSGESNFIGAAMWVAYSGYGFDGQITFGHQGFPGFSAPPNEFCPQEPTWNCLASSDPVYPVFGGTPQYYQNSFCTIVFPACAAKSGTYYVTLATIIEAYSITNPEDDGPVHFTLTPYTLWEGVQPLTSGQTVASFLAQSQYYHYSFAVSQSDIAADSWLTVVAYVDTDVGNQVSVFANFGSLAGSPSDCASLSYDWECTAHANNNTGPYQSSSCVFTVRTCDLQAGTYYFAVRGGNHIFYNQPQRYTLTATLYAPNQLNPVTGFPATGHTWKGQDQHYVVALANSFLSNPSYFLRVFFGDVKAGTVDIYLEWDGPAGECPCYTNFLVREDFDNAQSNDLYYVDFYSCDLPPSATQLWLNVVGKYQNYDNFPITYNVRAEWLQLNYSTTFSEGVSYAGNVNHSYELPVWVYSFNPTNIIQGTVIDVNVNATLTSGGQFSVFILTDVEDPLNADRNGWPRSFYDNDCQTGLSCTLGSSPSICRIRLDYCLLASTTNFYVVFTASKSALDSGDLGYAWTIKWNRTVPSLQTFNTTINGLNLTGNGQAGVTNNYVKFNSYTVPAHSWAFAEISGVSGATISSTYFQFNGIAGDSECATYSDSDTGTNTLSFLICNGATGSFWFNANSDVAGTYNLKTYLVVDTQPTLRAIFNSTFTSLATSSLNFYQYTHYKFSIPTAAGVSYTGAAITVSSTTSGIDLFFNAGTGAFATGCSFEDYCQTDGTNDCVFWLPPCCASGDYYLGAIAYVNTAPTIDITFTIYNGTTSGSPLTSPFNNTVALSASGAGNNNNVRRFYFYSFNLQRTAGQLPNSVISVSTDFGNVDVYLKQGTSLAGASDNYCYTYQYTCTASNAADSCLATIPYQCLADGAYSLGLNNTGATGGNVTFTLSHFASPGALSFNTSRNGSLSGTVPDDWFDHWTFSLSNGFGGTTYVPAAAANLRVQVTSATASVFLYVNGGSQAGNSAAFGGWGPSLRGCLGSSVGSDTGTPDADVTVPYCGLANGQYYAAVGFGGAATDTNYTIYWTLDNLVSASSVPFPTVVNQTIPTGGVAYYYFDVPTQAAYAYLQVNVTARDPAVTGPITYALWTQYECENTGNDCTVPTPGSGLTTYCQYSLDPCTFADGVRYYIRINGVAGNNYTLSLQAPVPAQYSLVTNTSQTVALYENQYHFWTIDIDSADWVPFFSELQVDVSSECGEVLTYFDTRLFATPECYSQSCATASGSGSCSYSASDCNGLGYDSANGQAAVYLTVYGFYDLSFTASLSPIQYTVTATISTPDIVDLPWFTPTLISDYSNTLYRVATHSLERGTAFAVHSITSDGGAASYNTYLFQYCYNTIGNQACSGSGECETLIDSCNFDANFYYFYVNSISQDLNITAAYSKSHIPVVDLSGSTKSFSISTSLQQAYDSYSLNYWGGSGYYYYGNAGYQQYKVVTPDPLADSFRLSIRLTNDDQVQTSDLTLTTRHEVNGVNVRGSQYYGVDPGCYDAANAISGFGQSTEMQYACYENNNPSINYWVGVSWNQIEGCAPYYVGNYTLEIDVLPPDQLSADSSSGCFAGCVDFDYDGSCFDSYGTFELDFSAVTGATLATSVVSVTVQNFTGNVYFTSGGIAAVHDPTQGSPAACSTYDSADCIIEDDFCSELCTYEFLGCELGSGPLYVTFVSTSEIPSAYVEACITSPTVTPISTTLPSTVSATVGGTYYYSYSGAGPLQATLTSVQPAVGVVSVGGLAISGTSACDFSSFSSSSGSPGTTTTLDIGCDAVGPFYFSVQADAGFSLTVSSVSSTAQTLPALGQTVSAGQWKVYSFVLSASLLSGQDSLVFSFDNLYGGTLSAYVNTGVPGYGSCSVDSATISPSSGLPYTISFSGCSELIPGATYYVSVFGESSCTVTFDLTASVDSATPYTVGPTAQQDSISTFGSSTKIYRVTDSWVAGAALHVSISNVAGGYIHMDTYYNQYDSDCYIDDWFDGSDYACSNIGTGLTSQPQKTSCGILDPYEVCTYYPNTAYFVEVTATFVDSPVVTYSISAQLSLPTPLTTTVTVAPQLTDDKYFYSVTPNGDAFVVTLDIDSGEYVDYVFFEESLRCLDNGNLADGNGFMIEGTCAGPRCFFEVPTDATWSRDTQYNLLLKVAAGTSFTLTPRLGAANCATGGLASTDFCSSVVTYSHWDYSLVDPTGADKDAEAQGLYNTLLEQFSICPPSAECLDALKTYVCLETYRGCDPTTSYWTPTCRGDCLKVEEECRSFCDIDELSNTPFAYTYLECSKPYYDDFEPCTGNGGAAPTTTTTNSGNPSTTNGGNTTLPASSTGVTSNVTTTTTSTSTSSTSTTGTSSTTATTGTTGKKSTTSRTTKGKSSKSAAASVVPTPFFVAFFAVALSAAFSLVKRWM